ncbi:hypothetical protein EDC65_0163 [Stella humosa]|uniref:Uncharacterized protein n=1 Tax=Stella humosa TaxID=94 RepID=A0A3N1MB75_9PROT|nr:hypothetical protein [Stella humosa]ROQ00993.1 hypothetical protein EDC65_0163 [Stella humosa]BBK31360.1 hypothetical protein STHU_19940 [Stella humosa]
MPEQKPARRLSLEEFQARIEWNGIPHAPERLEALHGAYLDLMVLTDRMRRGYGYADEPASIFPPEGRR